MIFPLWLLFFAVFLSIGFILYLLPGWMPPTVPFGVRIPPEFASEPVLVRLRHQYRRWIVVLGMVTALLMVLATRFLTASSSVVLISSFVPLLWLLGAYAVYYATRRKLLAIKREQGWYEGQHAAAIAEIPESASEERSRAQRLWLWMSPMVAISAVTLLLAIWQYPHLPAVMPIHFGLNGQPDAYAKKSVAVALIPFFAQLGLLIIIGLIMAFISRVHTPLDPAFPQTSSMQQRAFRRRTVIMLGMMGSATALSLLTGELLVLHVLSPEIAAWGIGLLPVSGLAGMIAVAARTGQLGSRVHAETTEQPTGVVARDDDGFWKGGIFYYNPEDPAFLAPKRFGVGWTFNFAHPGSWLIIGAILLIAISPLLLSLLLKR